jgi:hypothetical protein
MAIDSLEAIRAGDTTQWIRIRRPEDRTGISMEHMVADTISLLEFLHDRFSEKAYVAGFSAHTPHPDEPAKFRDLLLRIRDSRLAST